MYLKISLRYRNKQAEIMLIDSNTKIFTGMEYQIAHI